MARFRIILSAGVCSIALGGCIPAVAGLALSAANLVTGGGGGQGGKGFTNPIDRQTTGRDIRRALSSLDEQVDPACQSMLDQHKETHGTLTAGAAIQSANSASEAAPAAAQAGAETVKPPINLLAKVGPQPESTGVADVSVAADRAPDALAESAPGPTASADQVAGDQVAPESADVAAPEAGDQPVKASLGSNATRAPGQCEHRLVCLPGTPKPTLMMMCPGKGDRTASTDTNASTASDSAPTPDPAGESAVAPGEQTTASVDAAPNEAETGAASTTEAAKSAASASPAQAASSSPTPPEPARRVIESGGVADWNWSYDPSKRL